ncbi:hypothetical protein K438DRAFT_1936464 [Mycena galopus ATCC 62051]|nr:hypothetical protein K438DRAFT_1936464 [Mycena galopus ATCC 62051]
MSTSIFSATRVGFPPTPLSASEPRFRTSSKRYREPTDLIPTSRVDQKRPKPYEPVYFWLPVAVGTPLMMLVLGIALEVLYMLPVVWMLRALDCNLRSYQGNATAEESVLLDYSLLTPKYRLLLGNFSTLRRKPILRPRRPFWSMFRARYYNHRLNQFPTFRRAVRRHVRVEPPHFQSLSSLKIPLRKVFEAWDWPPMRQNSRLSLLRQVCSPQRSRGPPFVHEGWSIAEFVVFQSECNPTHVKPVNNYIADLLDFPYRLYHEYHIHPELEDSDTRILKRKGTHKTLQHNDVFELNPNIQSRPVLMKFSSLHLSFSLTIVSALFNYAGPLFLNWCPLYRRILDAINTPTPTRRDKGTTYNYALLMLICAVLKRKDFSGGVSKDAEDVTHKPNAHKRTQPQTKAEKKSAARREEHADDPKAGADTRKIGNLMAGDQTRIIVGTGFLYSLLGWSASAGFVVLLIDWPLNSYVSQR